jgi:hypothetical protein
MDRKKKMLRDTPGPDQPSEPYDPMSRLRRTYQVGPFPLAQTSLGGQLRNSGPMLSNSYGPSPTWPVYLDLFNAPPRAPPAHPQRYYIVVHIMTLTMDVTMILIITTATATAHSCANGVLRLARKSCSVRRH